MEEILDQKLLRYKTAENLEAVVALLDNLGIVKIEKDNGDFIREMTDNKIPYYEIFGRIKTIVLKQLDEEKKCALENKIIEYNVKANDKQKLVLEPSVRVYKHKKSL